MINRYELVGTNITGGFIFNKTGYYTDTYCGVKKLFINETNQGEFDLEFEKKYGPNETYPKGKLRHWYENKIDYDNLQAILNQLSEDHGTGISFRFIDLNRKTYFLCHKKEMPILVMDYIIMKSEQILVELLEK